MWRSFRRRQKGCSSRMTIMGCPSRQSIRNLNAPLREAFRHYTAVTDTRMLRKNEKPQPRKGGRRKGKNLSCRSGKRHSHDMWHPPAIWREVGTFPEQGISGVGNRHTPLHFPDDDLAIMLRGVGVPSIVFHRPYGLLRLFPQIEQLIVRKKLQLKRGGILFRRKGRCRRKNRCHIFSDE